MTIGVRGISVEGIDRFWVADNFRLYYLGSNPKTDLDDRLKKLQEKAEKLFPNAKLKVIQNSLNQLIEATAPVELDKYIALIDKFESQLDDAVIMIADTDKLLAKVEYAENNIYPILNYTDDLKLKIDAIKGLMDEEELTETLRVTLLTFSEDIRKILINKTLDLTSTGYKFMTNQDFLNFQ